MPMTTVRDIELIEVGSLGKETLCNDAFQNLALGIAGVATIALTNLDVTLTMEQGHCVGLILTGQVTGSLSVIVPQESALFVVDNRCTMVGQHTVTIRPPTGTGITTRLNTQVVIFCDGVNLYLIASGDATAIQPYDIGVTQEGVLTASQVLLRYVFPRIVEFPIDLTDSRCVAGVAATAITTFSIQKNGGSIGSLQFAAAATTATFTMASAQTFAPGDVLTVVAPASADATLASLGLTLAGTRG